MDRPLIPDRVLSEANDGSWSAQGAAGVLGELARAGPTRDLTGGPALIGHRSGPRGPGRGIGEVVLITVNRESIDKEPNVGMAAGVCKRYLMLVALPTRHRALAKTSG